MKKLLIIFILTLSNVNAGTGAHGGDPESLEFSIIARQLIYKIEKYGKTIFNEFKLEDLDSAVNDTQVKGYEFPNSEEGNKLRLQKFELGNNFELKCALNYSVKKIIEIDRSCFRKLSMDLKEALVFHEYLGIIGLEWDRSFISSKLALIRNQNLSQDNISYVEKIEELDSIYNSVHNTNVESVLGRRAFSVWTCEEYSYLNEMYFAKMNAYNFSEDGKNLTSQKFSMNNFVYDEKLGSLKATKSIGEDKFIEYLKFKDKKIYSKVISMDNGKETPILIRKCSSFRTDFSNRVEFIKNKIIHYYNLVSDGTKLLKFANKKFKSWSYRWCTGGTIQLDRATTLRVYDDSHMMNDEESDAYLANYFTTKKYFISSSCNRAYDSIMDKVSSMGKTEDKMIKDIYIGIEDLSKWGMSLSDENEQVKVNRSVESIKNLVVNNQAKIFQELSQLNDQYQCRGLKEKYMVECLLVSTIYQQVVVIPRARAKQLIDLDVFFEKLILSM